MALSTPTFVELRRKENDLFQYTCTFEGKKIIYEEIRGKRG